MENSSIVEQKTPTIGEALRAGLAMTIRYWNVTLIYWLCGVGLALIAALPFRATLLAHTGNTLLLDELIPGFNYTYLNDFLQNYGSALTPLLNQSLLILLVQFLLLVFLAGGLTKTVVDQPTAFSNTLFWGSSGAYFWRMLRLSLLFIVLHGIVLGVFVWLYLKVTKGFSPSALENEGIITSCLRWLVPLYVVFAALPMLWHDYAKLRLVQTNARWIWPPVGQAGKFIRRHFIKIYSLYALVLLMGLALLGLNYTLSSILSVQSLSTILLSLFLTQLFVILRFALKVLNMNSVAAMLNAQK